MYTLLLALNIIIYHLNHNEWENKDSEVITSFLS
jgi:hypothetical protein